MENKINLDVDSQVPVYKQLIESVQGLIENKHYRTGDYLPSMNQLAEELMISKETVKKAYSILREKGYIESTQGKGFYVADRNHRIKILVLFDKLSTYKQILFTSFAAGIGDISQITIRLHNQDISLFEHFIEENLDKFDYYIITAHFPLQPDIQKKALKILKKVPNRKLLLLDHYLQDLHGNFASVYQDFEKDIYEGLLHNVQKIKKFEKFNIFSTKGSMYAPLIEKGIARFCEENQVNYEIFKNIDCTKIRKNEAFLILNGQLDNELIELICVARKNKIRIGKDIGIISYNESPINEIVLGGLTVFSTDFKQMGELAAQMIMEKQFRKIRCDFRLIPRSTF
jgi:DNA-binding transcriptional regulator YhcF (GntR family)